MNKIVRNLLIGFFALLLLAGAFSGGLIIGWLMPSASTQQTSLANEIDTSEGDMASLFAPFWEAWDIVHEDFIDQPLDDNKLMQGAIRGMVEALGDSHTLYMTQDEYDEATVPLSGTYAGIGAFVRTDGDYLMITEPFEGSPAKEAGLKPGDQVIAVNGEDVTGIDPAVVLDSVKGEAGTSVVLTIHRTDPESTFDVEITRAIINYPTVTGHILTQDELPKETSVVLSENIAYISLTSFGETTAPDLENILDELLAQDPKGIILDLRYNSGGYLETAVDVVSEFLDEGVVLYEQNSDGDLTPYNTVSGGKALDIPLVILVDGGSASASEITAGAIQDYGRGVLVGTQTYGKGSVQYWIPLENEQGAVSVTIARWLTPKERQIDGVGLTPDYVVEFTDEDLANNNDVQLLKAVEILLEND
jgi:carboxyl-terminal processing protease